MLPGSGLHPGPIHKLQLYRRVRPAVKMGERDENSPAVYPVAASSTSFGQQGAGS